jgi:peptidoglycan/xylan/chitin deacetylase (PgdA/CDA1 family)
VRAVALVVEPGEDDARTENILRVLREKQVRATFAVTGIWGEAHRETLFSISSEGHQIINGTYDGRSWTGASKGDSSLTAGERKLALSRAEVTVYRYTSQSTVPYFYPPLGDVDESVLRDAAANGYRIVIVPGVSLATTARSEILAGPDNGAIIAVPPDVDAAILATVVDGLAGGGYGFITVKEMAS